MPWPSSKLRRHWQRHIRGILYTGRHRIHSATRIWTLISVLYSSGPRQQLITQAYQQPDEPGPQYLFFLFLKLMEQLSLSIMPATSVASCSTRRRLLDTRWRTEVKKWARAKKVVSWHTSRHIHVVILRVLKRKGYRCVWMSQKLVVSLDEV
jgi:hypothetical protein